MHVRSRLIGCQGPRSRSSGRWASLAWGTPAAGPAAPASDPQGSRGGLGREPGAASCTTLPFWVSERPQFQSLTHCGLGVACVGSGWRV